MDPVRSAAAALLLALLPRAQADSRPAEEQLELTVTVRQTRLGPQHPATRPAFTPQPPLVLPAAPPTAEQARTALARGLVWLRAAADRDGLWTFHRGQLRQGPDVPDLGFAGMAARSTCGRLVTNALVGLALWHGSHALGQDPEPVLSPVREFVLTQALALPPWTRQAPSEGGWAAALALQFLVASHSTADPALPGRIHGAAAHLVEVIARSQHPGSLVDQVRPRAAAPLANGLETEFGASLAVEEGGQACVLLRTLVVPTELRRGDRIVAIAGTPIPDWRACLERLRALPDGPTPFTVARPEEPRTARDTAPHDGGWSYEDHSSASMLGGHLLLALADAQSIGITAPADCLARGCASLEVLRFRDPDSGELGYRYANMIERCEGLPGTIARTPLIEWCLTRLGHGTAADVDAAVAAFLRHRTLLDTVLGTVAVHRPELHMAAPYYFLYGHWLAAAAARRAGSAEPATRACQQIRSVLLTIQHPPGTWTDHEGFGQLIGTALGVLALSEALAP